MVDKLSVFDPSQADPPAGRAGKLADPAVGGVEIYVPKGTAVKILQSVNKVLRTFPGKVPVTLILPNGGSELRRMNLPFSINPDSGLEERIKEILGDGAFKLS